MIPQKATYIIINNLNLAMSAARKALPPPKARCVYTLPTPLMNTAAEATHQYVITDEKKRKFVCGY